MDCWETAFQNHGHRFIGQLDYQRSIADPKTRKCDQHPTLTFEPQFLAVQTQTFINENFCFPWQVH